jgi:transposase-like protein
MSVLSRPEFHNEEAAYDYVEARIWPHGATCPKCGEIERVSKMGGKSTRIGAYKCYKCRKPFTVKVGTIFEASHVSMCLWLQAIYLMCSSKKGISSNQLHRTLGVTLKTAWFMSHRIREAMRSDGTVNFGTGGGIVEVDETFIGHKHKKAKGARGYAHKNAILSLVDRNTGQSKSFVVKDVTKATLLPILKTNIAKEAYVMTDEASQYKDIGAAKVFDAHGWTTHSAGEYVNREDPEMHTNTVEGFYSIFKRGMKGVYQYCDKKHLQRYAAEFEFRYNNRIANGFNDTDRSEIALEGIVGRRLTYNQPH